MKKEGGFILFAVAFVVLLLFSLSALIKERGGSKGVLFSPDFLIQPPVNCSNTSLTQMWSDIFIIPPENLTIVSDTSSEDVCNSYYLYRIFNDEELFLLAGYHPRESEAVLDSIYAVHGNYSASVIENIRWLNMTDVENRNYIYLAYAIANMGLPLLSKTREGIVENEINASQIYNDIFKIGNLSEFKYRTSTFSGVYYFNSTVWEDVASGAVFDKYIVENLMVLKNDTYVCIPSFVPRNTSCMSQDLIEFYFADENNCGVDVPENITYPCDYNANGVIGNESSLQASEINVSIYIGGRRYNSSEDYSNYSLPVLVEIRDNNDTIINFSYNFSVSLNLGVISVLKQGDSSDFGYLIVNGISETKTVKVDKLSGSSDGICVVSKDLFDIGGISDDCGSFGEVLVECPGEAGGIRCVLRSGRYIVSGLNHSAVKEFVPLDFECTPDWVCGDWSSCANGNRTRTCVDNSCGFSDRIESEDCVSCVPNWNCTDWSPERCPKNKTQAKTCEDTNNCGVTTNRPPLSQRCEYKPLISKKLKIGLIIGGALICVLAVLLIVFSLRRNKQELRHTAPRSGAFESHGTSY